MMGPRIRTGLMQAFLSYAPSDWDAVKALMPGLDEIFDRYGISTRQYDPTRVGDPIGDRTQWLINQSDLIIVFVSNTTAAKDDTRHAQFDAIRLRQISNPKTLVLNVILERQKSLRAWPVPALPALTADLHITISDWSPNSNDVARATEQIAQAIRTHLSTTPTPPPPQGLGTHFYFNEAGKLDIAPPDDLDAEGNHLPILRSLHPELREIVTSLSQRLPPGNNTHPHLGDRIAAYRALIDHDLDQIDFHRLYLVGQRLANALRATHQAIAAGESPTLPAEAREEIDSLLQFHGTFLLATNPGVQLLGAEERHDRTVEEELKARADTKNVVLSFQDAPQIITPEAQGALNDAVAEMGEGTHPLRSAIYGLSTVSNAVTTAVGAAIFVASPVAISTNIPGTGGMVSGGVLAWIGLEGLKKSKAAQQTFASIGVGIDAAQEAIESKLRERLARLPDFVASVDPVLRRYAAGRPGGAWIKRSLDWLAKRHPAIGSSSTVEPSNALSASALTSPPHGFSQAAAERLILAGIAPPSNWHPYIDQLGFGAYGLDRSGNLYVHHLVERHNHVDLSLIANLRHLERLSLASTDTKDLSPLSRLSELRELHLDMTNVSQLGPISNLEKLELLDLRDTEIEILKPISALKCLKLLRLDGTKISDISPLGTIASLSDLSVSRTAITHIDLGILVPLPNLRRLSVKETPAAETPIAPGMSEEAWLALDGTVLGNPWAPKSLYIGASAVMGNWRLGFNAARRRFKLSEVSIEG